MRTRRLVIWTLGLINAVLLAVVIALCYDMPAAYAQRSGGGSGQYAAVSAQFTGGTDALFLLHAGKRQLTVLAPEQDQTGRLKVVGSRDLKADLGG